MPRKGLSNEDILKAIEALLARCEPITRTSIRHELGGTGSYTTISAFLKTWRESVANEAPPEESLPIPTNIQALFVKVWAAAHSSAQAELSTLREAIDQESVALRMGFDKASAENDEIIRILEFEKSTLESQLTESKTRERSSQACVADLSETIGSLKAKLDQANGELSSRTDEHRAKVSVLETLLEEAHRIGKDAQSETNSVR